MRQPVKLNLKKPTSEYFRLIEDYWEAEEWSRSRSGSKINPTFEPDCLPQSLSPVKDEKKGSGDKGIFLVNLNEMNQEVEEYEPYDNRVVDHPTTNIETLLHLLKGSLGTGILAMPHAFSNAGYVVGSIGTIVIGVLCSYCIHVLLDSCYVMCKRRKVPSMTYTAVAEAALSEGPDWCKACAPYAAHVVNVFLLIYQIGTCCVYVVFVSENIQYVLTQYFELNVTVVEVMLWILLPLVLINWVRDLKYLAPFSGFANVVTIVGFAIILYYLFREAPTLEGKAPAGKLANFPLFFGTVLFALEAIGVILPLENEMKTPKDFVGSFGVLNRAMITIIILYVGMGLFGYLTYGDSAAGSITLNLPSDTELLASIVQGLLAFAIFITHGLACYVAIDIVWNEYIGTRLHNSSHRIIWEYVVRTCIVLITFGIAAAVPELDLFISLFGALCLSALGLAFPAIIQSCTYWYYVSDSERIRMIIKNVIVVLFGALGLVVGTWTSLDGIIRKFSAHHVLNATAAITESTILNDTLSVIP
ncbi:proton-coupled amino acid transporter-like protein CG1139 isoform X1 [Pieris brassicae]|uniref:proton-coupled amino acid transporter-like protein CG1139 isoform X1 n=1 Tax=Pieris brassicae TaxID=7116 RepID=UPI001E660B9B|nr:proton-coupled amino acid transporter-like protein CG1139 isoform X1 [Pieris brassicae]